MKKRIILFVAIALVLISLIGCAKTVELKNGVYQNETQTEFIYVDGNNINISYGSIKPNISESDLKKGNIDFPGPYEDVKIEKKDGKYILVAENLNQVIIVKDEKTLVHEKSGDTLKWIEGTEDLKGDIE